MFGFCFSGQLVWCYKRYFGMAMSVFECRCQFLELSNQVDVLL